MGFCKWVDEQSALIKILLFIPMWGWAIAFLYKLFTFIDDNSKTMTLVGAILDLFFIGALVDFILVILGKKLLFVE